MEATSLPRGRALHLPRRILATLDDERLVAQMRSGNGAAFEVAYDRHHRGILAYCRHLLGSREEAEDALQQTFASAYDELVAGQRELKLKAWLYTIARNRCLSVLRARREYPAELRELETAGLGDEVQRRADLRELLADLHELPEPQRAALVLAEVGDLAHAEIAQVLGCDVAKVKSLVFQARSGLIERRQARDTPCREIREQLATLRGGALRRGPLRRHLKACPGCAAYREEVRRQRAMLAVALPVIPSLGLRESALAAAGLGGAGGAGSAALAGGGGAVAGGGAAAASGVGAAAGSGGSVAAGSLIAKAGLAKVAVAVVAGTAAIGGGTAVVTSGGGAGGDRPPAPAAREGAAPARGAPALAPAPGRPRGESPRRAGQGAGRERGQGRRDGARRADGNRPPEGVRGRELARTRGRGRKRGLEGTQPGRTRAGRRRPERAPARNGGAPSGRSPAPRERNRTREAPPARPRPGPGARLRRPLRPRRGAEAQPAPRAGERVAPGGRTPGR